MRKDRKKSSWKKYIGSGICMIMGAICGILSVEYFESIGQADRSVGEMILNFGILLLEIYLASLIQTVIHEGGHLICGLLSGYRFSSFRIGSLMWVKQNEKLHFKRLSIAGTGGQCLMEPPELINGKMPFLLYNLGGIISNIIFSLLFVTLAVFCKGESIFSSLWVILALMGFFFALINGIPMHIGNIDNDGYNAISLGKNREALRAFWIQMKVNEQIVKGIRIKDMPEEWFVMPTEERMKNGMTAVIGVFACNRLMDMEAFEQADKLMEELLEMDTGIVGLHRHLLICDRIYCELIAENDQDIVEDFLDKKQKAFMKSMKKFPSVLRTEYAYALLSKKDIVQAGKIKEMFEKCARKYPYPNEVESERELMAYAEEKKIAHDSIAI